VLLLAVIGNMLNRGWAKVEIAWLKRRGISLLELIEL
jgi:hypothetical protein